MLAKGVPFTFDQLQEVGHEARSLVVLSGKAYGDGAGARDTRSCSVHTKSIETTVIPNAIRATACSARSDIPLLPNPTSPKPLSRVIFLNEILTVGKIVSHTHCRILDWTAALSSVAARSGC